MFRWFETQIRANGPGVLACTSPAGVVSGMGSVSITPESDPQLSLEVEGFATSEEYPGMLYSFLQAELPRREAGRIVFSIGTGINPGTLTIQTDEGQFVGSNVVHYGGTFGTAPERVVPHVTDLAYRSNISVSPKYCVLPLCNLKTQYVFLPELASHPLVLDESKPLGIRFDVCGTPAYIQPLSDEESQASGIAALLVTEMLPGVTDSLDSMKEHFPFELISALQFATGSRVFAPWIELRGPSAELVCRLHARVGKSANEEGHEFLGLIHLGQDSGLGAFLSKFMQLNETTRAWMEVAMNLCVSATPGTSTVDDNLAFVFRGFELLVKNHNIGRLDLRAQLSSKALADLDSAIEDLRNDLSTMRALARRDKRIDDDRVLERIQSRLANVQTADSDIGLTMCELIRAVGFPDIDILDSDFIPSNFGGKTWAKVVSELRQDTVHEGYLEFAKKHDIRATFSILRHLHDLLARLILAESGYQGTYNPAVASWTSAVPITWVTPTLKPAKLGFG